MTRPNAGTRVPRHNDANGPEHVNGADILNPAPSARPAAPAAGVDVDGLPLVQHARPEQARHLAALIGREFRDLPPSQWLIGNRTLRPLLLADFFTIATEHAASGAGVVEVLADESAVAVWFNNTREHPGPADYERRVLAAVGEQHFERFVALDGVLGRHHPTEPHHHLAFIAVAGKHRGTGRAAKLLRHHHDQLDAGCLPAYLEAASPELVLLYRNFGYREREPFHLPAGGPPFFPMWRDPRPN